MRKHPLIPTVILYILLVQSWFFQSSAVNHLVQSSERCQDATFVGLHDLPVLDHLIQDDVDSIQVEHDLMAVPSQRCKHTHTHTGGLSLMSQL